MQASLHLSGDPKCIWARTVVCIEAEAELLCRDAKHIEDGSDELLGGEELIVEEKGEHDSCQIVRSKRAKSLSGTNHLFCKALRKISVTMASSKLMHAKVEHMIGRSWFPRRPYIGSRLQPTSNSKSAMKKEALKIGTTAIGSESQRGEAMGHMCALNCTHASHFDLSATALA